MSNRRGSGRDGFRNNLPSLLSLVLGLCGFIVLVWLGIEDPSRREDLADAADWLMKGGIGVFFGTLVGRRAR